MSCISPGFSGNQPVLRLLTLNMYVVKSGKTQAKTDRITEFAARTEAAKITYASILKDGKLA